MSTRKYKVLVVDDDPDIRDLVSQFLSLEGHFCEMAGDGAEALNKATNGQFDALITDIRMPRMNGLKLADEVLKGNNSLPVMIMTGEMDEVTAERIFSAGAKDFIYKPFSMVELGVRFARMMRENESVQTFISPNISL
ncbi:MAG TPA: response regulator [Dissulfurispiraceae bacterium]|nr:response regulator [Dissulfurispiraceae bacterium]